MFAVILGTILASPEKRLKMKEKIAAEQARQSCLSDWIGDGYCDDLNNYSHCNYDGGDCCGPNVKTDFCQVCVCHQRWIDLLLLFVVHNK